MERSVRAPALVLMVLLLKIANQMGLGIESGIHMLGHVLRHTGTTGPLCVVHWYANIARR